MLGIDKIKITPALFRQVCALEEFKGFWSALEAHTTGLQMLKEVAEYGGNFKKILSPLKGRDLTPSVLSTLHAAQLRTLGQSPYRTVDYPLSINDQEGNAVGVLETAPAEDIKNYMEKLSLWLNKAINEGELHPLLVIAGFTAVFLQISPYETDNLKMARFMMVLLMLRTGYSYAPYIALEPIMNDKARNIHASLQTLQTSLEEGKPEWAPWLSCFMDILLAQKSALQARMFEKNKALSHLPTLSGKILKLFEHHNRLQMKQIVKLTNGRRSTIKLRLGEMVEQGYIRRYGNARATWYSLI